MHFFYQKEGLAMWIPSSALLSEFNFVMEITAKRSRYILGYFRYVHDI
jgi:hypothetical protein